jgi:UPF0042 nucleotide-binding protein
MTETAPAPPIPAAAMSRIVLVTGPSGAGRSTAINALEDLGFEAIDNLPLGLIPRLLDGPPLERPLALGIAAPTRGFTPGAVLDLLDGPLAGLPHDLLYLECRADILLRRYSETRRRHPLAPAESPRDGIAREFDLLVPIRERADILIDTSEMSLHDLRAEIDRMFGTSGEDRLAVTVQSFSYKRGLPRGLDFVFDCRFLRNPYWDDALRHLDGRDDRVAAYIRKDARHDAFFERVVALVDLLLPAHVEEGKRHLAIGFGCTGGRHRSVCVTEALAHTLADAGWRVSIRHRELGDGGGADPGNRGKDIEHKEPGGTR